MIESELLSDIKINLELFLEVSEFILNFRKT